MDTEEAVLSESGPDYGSDRYWMGLALREARSAAQAEEVPVGAVIVDEHGQLLARDRNRVEQFNDVTAHAELLVCTAAAHALGGKYLKRCTLYVTLEPCAMCAAALRWFQLGRLVWGASDPKAGYRCFAPLVLHPKTRIVSDVEASASSQLLKAFFQHRRTTK